MIAVCIFICCVVVVFGDYCGENKVPFGLEVHRNGQPSLLCARPNCNERKFLDCEDHAIRSSCPENNTIVGGFDKGYGNHQPLYLLCCVFDDLIYSVPLYNSIVVHPGEYFEGEEQVEEQSEAIKSFDVITSMKLIDDPNTT
uniref:CLIP domain-containing serine protease n=1 Tax=Syphacia muris TaxID=451379 RepID=A0A0N5AYG9_9BILA